MTTTQDPTEVRLAPFGKVYIAPAGTAIPTDVTTALVSPFVEVGLITDDGVSLTPSTDTTDIKAWQSLTPVKTTLTAIGLTCKFSMMQVNQETTAEYFFGNTWTNVAGVGVLNLSAAPSLQERVLVIEWNDDENNTNRLCFGRGLFTDRDALQLQRADATALGLTYEALELGGSIGKLLSNDPDLIPST
jgi:hypothetical protein